MDRKKPAPEHLAEYADGFNASVIMKHHGFHVGFAPDGSKVIVTIDPIRPEHRGGLGTAAVNGGVLAATFDLAIGCTPALLDPRKRNATMQLSMSFLRPVTGSRFTAESWIDRAGTETLFASAKILDEEGRVCATCQGLVKLSDQPWPNGTAPMKG